MKSSRKELKQAYKERKAKMGVFQITNKANGKALISSSMDLEQIWNRFRFELNMGSHRNKKIQKDWTAFGEDRFTFEVLEIVKENPLSFANYPKLVKELEAVYIERKKLDSEEGYN